MLPLEEQEDPTFASVAETPQLQRPHCDQCRVAIAEYSCGRCVQHFCSQCEMVIHHRLEQLAIKEEESKGDGRPHQEFLKWTNACQVCSEKTLAFFCISCNMYQCEGCCASRHSRSPELHFFFCVEGASPAMFPFASWNPMFVEMVKMSKGILQDRATAAETAMGLASRTAQEFPHEKCDATAVANIKLEQAATASTTATAAALGNLSIRGSTQETTPQQPKSQAKRGAQANTTSIVDLTLDDDSDASTSSAPPRPTTEPQIKQEVRVKSENAWLTSATAAQENPVFDVDEMMEKTMGEDEDLVLRSMIGEYNQLSSQIFDISQEADNAKAKAKELSKVRPINMQEVQKVNALTKKLRTEQAKAVKSRDSVVANIVVYLKPDPEELKAFLKTCTVDVSSAQAAIHRKCATLEASILSNLENIQRIQRNMDELINLKKDAFAEVTRLGGEIAQGEEEVRKLDKERQEEFLRLCQFSQVIRDMVASTSQ